ncbi:hypothetical protein ABT354_35885 [Streptomyces sp. NPDC000594]|uniref:hypothetical protein n=1 Tax=Streptomyces sp. NPDC000594 TaxID=3154261 RepID=UPI00332C55F4
MTACDASGKSSGDVFTELTKACLHLNAARALLGPSAEIPYAPLSLLTMSDQAQTFLDEIRALLVAMGLTDADLQALLGRDE